MSTTNGQLQRNWTDCGAPLPAPGTVVNTACGGTVQYTPNTPCILYRGELVYFCLPVCKQSFEKDPSNSCLIGYSPAA